MFGAFSSAKLSGSEPNIVKYLGITLLPQAGVALGMCSIAAADLPGQGALIRNITLIHKLFKKLLLCLPTEIASKIF